jgi:hypothetical protein
MRNLIRAASRFRDARYSINPDDINLGPGNPYLNPEDWELKKTLTIADEWLNLETLGLFTLSGLVGRDVSSAGPLQYQPLVQ